LRNALDADWPDELARVGMAGIGTNVAFVRTQVVTDPPWSSTALPARVTIEGKEQPFSDFFQDCIKAVHAQLSEAFMDTSRDVVKSMADLKKARYEQDVVITTKKLTTLQSTAGEHHALVPMSCHAVVTAMVLEVPVERRLYGLAQLGVTEGVIRRDDRTEFRVTAVQVPGKELSPHFERVDRPRPESQLRKPKPPTSTRTTRPRGVKPKKSKE
jgi:hypothetical protein